VIAATNRAVIFAGRLGENVVFGSEGLEEGTAADPSGRADLGHGDVAVPAPGEQNERCVDGRRPAVHAVTFSQVRTGGLRRTNVGWCWSGGGQPRANLAGGVPLMARYALMALRVMSLRHAYAPCGSRPEGSHDRGNASCDFRCGRPDTIAC
jgi:hypothetical protein